MFACECIACRTRDIDTCEVGEFGIVIEDNECEEDPVPARPLNVAPATVILDIGDTVWNMEVMAG